MAGLLNDDLMNLSTISQKPSVIKDINDKCKRKLNKLKFNIVDLIADRYINLDEISKRVNRNMIIDFAIDWDVLVALVDNQEADLELEERFQ